MLTSLLDTVLDRTVVPGYSAIGYRVRRRWWSDDDLERMDGKTVLVTGATSGLGLAAARGFAELGASVWLVARDRERGEHARAEVSEHTDGGQARLALCDLARLDSVRELAAQVAGDDQGLDVLVNNAGVMTERRQLSADGVELTFAVNVLAPFLLTGLLVPALKRAALSRIITVTSGGMYPQRLDADDLQSERGDFAGAAVYARTKRAEVILTEMWAPRLAPHGVMTAAMHPGWADTPGVKASLPRFYRATKPLLRTAAQGADTIVWLGAAAQPAGSTGELWHDRRRRPVYLWPRTREAPDDRQRLWRECVRLSGLDPDRPDRG